MIGRLGARVARLMLALPPLSLALALLLGGAAAMLASNIRFDTRFDALLPENDPVVKEARELQALAGGTVELVIALRGDDSERRLAFGREVVAELRKHDWIRRADVEFPVDFFLDRRMWLAPLDTLKKLQEDIELEIDRARARANPLYVDLEDDEGGEEKPWEAVERQYNPDKKSAMLKKTFTSPENRYLFVRVKPMGNTFDMAQGKTMLGRIEATVQALKPADYGVKVRYAGGLVSNQQQNDQMTEDFRAASVIALSGIVLLMGLYIRRITAPLVVAVPLMVGVMTTVAFTVVTIGQFNLVTGFLVSVLFGLGIDFEIHLYLRYLELLSVEGEAERGDPVASVSLAGRRRAMVRAVARTLPGCATSAMTTSAAFFALTISDFRGFREYGIIAGTGVLVTLCCTFLFLPPLAVLVSRRGRKPLADQAVRPLPRRLARAMVATGLGMLVFSLVALPQVEVRTNFRQLKGTSPALEFDDWVSSLLGGTLSPAAILVNTTEQARRVEEYLDPLTKDPKSLIKRHISLAAMVPQQVAQKRKVLAQIEESLAQVAEEKLTEEDREKVEEGLKLARAKPWGVDEVPEVFRKQFLTVDGKKQFVVVWPRVSLHEDRVIIRWGNELERIRSDLRELGIPVRILDQNRVGAEVLEEMAHDAPYAVSYAALAVLLLLIIDFRRPKQVLLVAGALATGVLWMLGMQSLLDVTINVFNQAMLPTIIGVGIDNAVHIQHRYMEEGPGSVPRVMATTGSAALLASATTALGFGSALIAHHLGIQSLGWLSVIGVSCTFISSTVFLPAVLSLLDRRKREAESAAPAA